MIAFIVATPLQVFNSLNILKYNHSNEKADFYVMSFAVKNIDEYMGHLEKQKYVNEVIYLDNLCNIDGKIGVIKDYFLASKKVFKNKVYSDLYTTWIGDRSTLIYHNLLKNNKNMRLHFYEEGIGIYIHDICIYSKTLIKMYQLFNINYDRDNINDIVGYRPEFIYSKNKYKVSQIKVLKDTNILEQSYFNEAFGNNSEIFYKQRYIYLENCFFRDKKDERYQQYKSLNQVLLLDSISNIVGKENILVRKHPITKAHIYEDSGYKIDVNNSIPWELLLLNYNMKNNVLITIISTAVFSPKMMFDEEPIVIILAKAFKNEFSAKEKWADTLWTNEFQKLVYNLKSLYSDPERVIIPEDFNDFKNVLKRIES